MTLHSEYLNEIHALEVKCNLLAKETTLSGQNKFVALSQLIRTVRNLENRNMPFFVLRDAVKATNDFVDNKITFAEYLTLSREMGTLHPKMGKSSSILSNAMMAFSWAVFLVSIITLPLIPAVLGILASFVLADIARELKTTPSYHSDVSELGRSMNKVSRYSFLDTLATEKLVVEEPVKEEEKTSSWAEYFSNYLPG